MPPMPPMPVRPGVPRCDRRAEKRAADGLSSTVKPFQEKGCRR